MDLIKKGHKVEYSKETHGGGQAIFIDRKKDFNCRFRSKKRWLCYWILNSSKSIIILIIYSYINVVHLLSCFKEGAPT